MSDDSKLDALLRDFLEKEAANKANDGITLRTIYELLQDVADVQSQLLERQARYQRRLERVEKQLTIISDRESVPDWQVDKADITGVHNLREVQRHIAERRDSSIWWHRKRWDLVFSAIGAAVLVLLSALVTWLVSTHR